MRIEKEAYNFQNLHFFKSHEMLKLYLILNKLYINIQNILNVLTNKC